MADLSEDRQGSTHRPLLAHPDTACAQPRKPLLPNPHSQPYLNDIFPS